MFQIFTQYERELSINRVLSAPASQKVRSIIDAMLFARKDLMRYGAVRMNLVLRKDGSFRLKPKEKEEG